MDHWVTNFVDRFFVNEPTAEDLRAIMVLAAFAQAAIAAAGLMLLWHAIGCGLSRHFHFVHRRSVHRHL